jgi:lipid II:glycine glycyltransferase (peptidoglycan interpeptide bridge formation enzyme)
LGYSNKEGRKINVMNGLLWKAIIELKKKNLSYFDLGGLDEINTPKINKFKLGINGKNYELVGNYNSINII